MASDETPGPVPQDDHVRDVRLPVRLYTSVHVHRLVPTRVALALAARFGTPGSRHDRKTELKRAEYLMKDLLLHTPRAGEARQLARRNVEEISRLREMFWRPWLIKHSRVIGREHWDAAHAGGDGCVAVICHVGASALMVAILGHHGLPVYSVSTPRYWEPMPPGFFGRMTLRLRDYAEAQGRDRVILSDGPAERLITLLERGESLFIAIDVPGSAATPFLGRSVALDSGPATLAFRTGVKVLPMIAERNGSHVDLRIFEALDPADFRDSLSLRVAMASVFERLILEKPEIVDYAWYPSPLVTEVPPEVPSAEAVEDA